MTHLHRRRRVLLMACVLAGLLAAAIIGSDFSVHPSKQTKVAGNTASVGASAQDALDQLTIKGRAPKTDYAREQFGAGWVSVNGCDTRNIILYRDLTNVVTDESCQVQTGTLDDPYSGKTLNFLRGAGTSTAVQIDHVIALSDAWQKGAQAMTMTDRIKFANDPLELLAVDGPSNQQKSDGDAATWLPSHVPFRCQYVARQIAVKQKYSLWVTQAEYDAIKRVLGACPGQLLPSEE